jgi:hypothetical protein
MVLLCFLLLAFKAGMACTCTPIKSIRKEFLNSSSVFIGRVISITPVQISIDSVNTTTQYRVVFELKQGFKNAWKKRIQVITGAEDDCGFRFLKDNEYLVFTIGGLVLETNQCTRTRELVEAEIDVMVLNYLVRNPQEESEEDDKSKNE